MKRLSWGLALALMILALPMAGLGQGCPSSGISFQPFVSVGMQSIGVNFGLDGFYSHVGGAGPGQGNLDVRLNGLKLWTGAVGGELDWGSNLFLFASAEASAPKKIDVIMAREPMAGWLTVGPDPVLPGAFAVDPITWSGTGVEWWRLDFGAGYRGSDTFTILAGVKIEHLTLALRDPRDASGRSLNVTHQIDGIVGSSQGQTAECDFYTKLTIPYLGGAIRAGGATGAFIFSPIVSANVKTPIRAHANAFLPFAGGLQGYYQIEWDYSLFRVGAFCEALLDYHVGTSHGFGLSLWGRGRWLRVKGSGDLTYKNDYVVPIAPMGYTNLQSSGGDSSYTNYALSGGITGQFTF